MRLFFGLSLPPSAREATADYARRAAQAVPGRYALPDNHHITLAFLGEVEPARAGEAEAVLAACAAAFPAPQGRSGARHTLAARRTPSSSCAPRESRRLRPCTTRSSAPFRNAVCPSIPGRSPRTSPSPGTPVWRAPSRRRLRPCAFAPCRHTCSSARGTQRACCAIRPSPARRL